MRYPNLEEKIAIILDKKYGGENNEWFRADEARLRGGEPLEYVLGYADFLGCHIDMSCTPMVPRYETAFWVHQAIHDLLKREDGTLGALRIADTFAGAGNVGTPLLKYILNTTVEFHELDAELLPGITQTLKENDINIERAKFISADGLSGLTGLYDAIFAVPPYVDPKDIAELDPDMRDHEPHLAFFADEHGRAHHRMLIENAWDFLSEGGTLYMETDMDHEAGTKEMLEGTKWSSVEFWPDPYGATPNVVLRK